MRMGPLTTWSAWLTVAALLGGVSAAIVVWLRRRRRRHVIEVRADERMKLRAMAEADHAMSTRRRNGRQSS